MRRQRSSHLRPWREKEDDENEQKAKPARIEKDESALTGFCLLLAFWDFRCSACGCFPHLPLVF